MSGGMDIDWGRRDALLKKAQEKFGNLTKEELFDRSEANSEKIKTIQLAINELHDAIRHLTNDEDLIWALCKERKYF